ncbi:hypothetical protein V5O48_013183 [Marasmius crinis-equi]|uniref:Uncharacterized protein n=1 Tax=Marasmius crinis-equi TaxID=585013 RepID=A0ABR3F0T4_9AGAR
MASSNPPPLAERTDVHKACKSIENLLSVFNDYCEAVGVIATLQKKLSKALRETAGMKVTGEIAANALNASATIFEALNEVDAKFAKLADKEYDGISEEVKKWFRKLAKEERLHDERIVAANNKIKAAGKTIHLEFTIHEARSIPPQGASYEKKSKKNPRDANEEHVRYINLISAMGPEISQDKFNHSLMVTQRHSSTTFSIAACVSRVADAEWTKACEGVRRFSPTIGKLGEWRSLCEGGWTGPIPQDLPDIDEIHPQQAGDSLEQRAASRTQEEEDNTSYNQATIRGLRSENESIPEPGGNVTGTSTPTFEGDPNEEPTSQRHIYQKYEPTPYSSGGGNLNKGGKESAPPTAFSFGMKFQDDTTGSVRSLSAFPSPPTHYPLPPTMTQRQKLQQPSQAGSSSSSSASQISSPTTSRPADRQTPATEKPENVLSMPAVSPAASPAPSPVHVRFQNKSPSEPADVLDHPASEAKGSPQPAARAKPIRSETLDPSMFRTAEPISPRENMPSPSRSLGRNDHIPEEPEQEPGPSSSPHVRDRPSIDGVKPTRLERTDTGTSNGSMVAAMRNRYSYNSGASSPPLSREMPRLPQSVSDLASKYDRPASPPGARPLPSIDTNVRPRHQDASQWEREREREPTVTAGHRSVSGSREPTPATTADEELAARRRHQQRMEQMADLELREKEQELKRREQEIEERAKQLEKERAQFLQKATLSSPEMRSPRQRQLSQQEHLGRPHSSGNVVFPSTSPSPSPRIGGNANLRPQSQYSASATHLVPPGPSPTTPRGSYRDGDESYVGDYRGSSSRDPSIASTTSNSMASSPVMPSPKSERKGWMRRLSMPIVAGNAFLEGKKHSSNNSYGGGKGGILSLDSKKNGSSTYLKGGISEEGRVNYGLGSGISNRSVGNVSSRR